MASAGTSSTRWCITIRPCMSENRVAATALVSEFAGMYPSSRATGWPVRRCGRGFRDTAHGYVSAVPGREAIPHEDGNPCLPLPFRPIEHLIYNFPVLISSPLFRIGVEFSD